MWNLVALEQNDDDDDDGSLHFIVQSPLFIRTPFFPSPQNGAESARQVIGRDQGLVDTSSQGPLTQAKTPRSIRSTQSL